MTHPEGAEPLRPMLKAAQNELAKALDEACAHEDVNEESTAELIKLEESLSDAAQAAKQAVSLRRRLGTGHGAGPGASSRTADEATEPRGDQAVERRPVTERRAAAPGGAATGESDAVREFQDANGVLWRAWAVKPGQSHPERAVENRLGEYSNGWLAFETADESQRRRLPHHPPDWSTRSERELQTLLESAEPVKARKKSDGEGERAST